MTEIKIDPKRWPALAFACGQVAESVDHYRRKYWGMPSEADGVWIANRIRAELAEFVAERVAAQPAWISVGERLPEKGHGRVLATDGSNVAVVQHYGYSSWGAHRVSIDTKHLTHWQPLPEPPGEET